MLTVRLAREKPTWEMQPELCQEWSAKDGICKSRTVTPTAAWDSTTTAAILKGWRMVCGVSQVTRRRGENTAKSGHVKSAIKVNFSSLT